MQACLHGHTPAPAYGWEPWNTSQVLKLVRLLQDSYLHQFGGSGKNSKGVKETLARYPLRSRALEPWFHALSYVVDISPAQAHAIVSQHSSLGQLMAIYADPSRCNHVLCDSVIIINTPFSFKLSPSLSGSACWLHLQYLKLHVDAFILQAPLE